MRIIDQSLHAEIAMPTAAETVSTAAVDLKTTEAGPLGRQCEVHITLPLAANTADTETQTVAFEDCDTSDGSFAAVTTTGNMISTGADAAGSPAALFRFYLPPHTRQYVRASCTQTGVGDNSTVNLEIDFKV